MSIEVREIISAAEHSPAAISRILVVEEKLAVQLLFNVAIEQSGGELVGATEAASSAASGIAALLILGGLLNAIAILIYLRWMKLALLAMFGNIWVVGPHLRGIINAVWAPVDWLEASCMNSAHSLASAAWSGIQHFVRWEIDRIFPHTNTGKSVVTNSNLAPIYAQLGNEAADIQALQHEMQQLQHQVQGAHGSPTVDTQPIYQSLHQLSHAIDVLYHNQTNLYGDIQTVQHNQTVLMHDLHQLQHQLTGVRTVQIGWADVVEQLQDLESSLSHQVASLQADMRTAQQRLVNLAPLSLLLQPGLRGLRNLRKLEDNPCQCPQPQFLRPRNVEALAIELAIANGV